MKSLQIAIQSGANMMIDPVIAQAHIARVAKFADVDKFANSADFTKMLEMVFGPQPKYEVVEGVAYIPLKGVIGKGLTSLEKATGGCDIDDIQGWIAQAMSDPEVKAVVMDVNTPGGGIRGVQETAHAYRELGKAKPTLTYCEDLCASAGYYIGSQGNRFLATPSSEIGSVGVYTTIADYTKALDNEGVKVSVIRSGKFKAIGHPALSLDKEQEEHLQASVNSDHEIFKQDVKAVRQFAKDEDMDGQLWSGREAAAKFLVTSCDNNLGRHIKNLVS